MAPKRKPVVKHTKKKATKKATTKKSAGPKKPGKNASRMDVRQFNLQKLRHVLKTEKAEVEPIFRRQIEVNEDPFAELYDKWRILRPIYDFDKLYTVYSESDVLQSCVEAMQQNVDGFGFQLDFTGKDQTDREKPGPQKEYKKLMTFFSAANETQSWVTIRKLMREDLEVLGNGAFEVIRDRRNRIAMLYHLPFRNIRMTKLDTDWTTTTVTIPREGGLTNMRIKKKFRRYVQLNKYDQNARWFKELGDKRIMDATDGKYKDKTSDCKMVASEIWHFKLPFGGQTYGLPRWLGVSLDVMGRRMAGYVNYDLFQSQGIPPMAILIAGGVLTDESIEEIENMVRGMRGYTKWNRIALLEANPETQGIEEKGNVKMELKNMTEFRKEDQMFDRYLKTTASNIRHRYRLPPLYTGAAETFTHATAKSARSIAEEQVFVPERSSFDEKTSSQIIRSEFKISNWLYRSKGPKIANPDEVSKGVETFAKAGAFSVNHAIERANESFGLQMSKYSEGWADLPITVVLKMLELGTLWIDVNGNKVTLPKPGEGPNGNRIGGHAASLPTGDVKARELPTKILKSDIFSDEEKEIYKKLLVIQDAVDSKRISVEDSEI